MRDSGLGTRIMFTLSLFRHSLSTIFLVLHFTFSLSKGGKWQANAELMKTLSECRNVKFLPFSCLVENTHNEQFNFQFKKKKTPPPPFPPAARPLGAGNLRQHTLALATQRLQSYGARDGWHGSDGAASRLGKGETKKTPEFVSIPL